MRPEVFLFNCESPKYHFKSRSIDVITSSLNIYETNIHCKIWSDMWTTFLSVTDVSCLGFSSNYLEDSAIQVSFI